MVSTAMCTASGIRPDKKRWLFNWVITGAFPASRLTITANISLNVIYSKGCSNNSWSVGPCAACSAIINEEQNVKMSNWNF